MTTIQSGVWQRLDMYRLLQQLHLSGHTADVRQILASPRKLCPELLILGLAAANR